MLGIKELENELIVIEMELANKNNLSEVYARYSNLLLTEQEEGGNEEIENHLKKIVKVLEVKIIKSYMEKDSWSRDDGVISFNENRIVISNTNKKWHKIDIKESEFLHKLGYVKMELYPTINLKESLTDEKEDLWYKEYIKTFIDM